MSWTQPLEDDSNSRPYAGLDIHPTAWAKLCGKQDGFIRGRMRGNASNANSDHAMVTSVEMTRLLHDTLLRISQEPSLGYGSKGAVLRAALMDLIHFLHIEAVGDTDFQQYIAGRQQELQVQEDLDRANYMLDRFESDTKQMQVTFERLARVPDPVTMHELLDSQAAYWEDKRPPYGAKAMKIIQGYREQVKHWPRTDVPDDQHPRLRVVDL